MALQPFYVTINDVLGADVSGAQFDPDAMTLFGSWADSKKPKRAAIARGAKLFGTKPIAITGVGGLNDALGLPTIQGTCTTCHDSPNIGNHSVALPIDIGLTDASRRTPDMPLYTLQNIQTGESRTTTDPGRALLTGRWSDIGKFKGPSCADSPRGRLTSITGLLPIWARRWTSTIPASPSALPTRRRMTWSRF